MAKSRFSRITESPTKSEEARKLLQEALAKSGELVASLEGRLKVATAEKEEMGADLKRTHCYWQEDREELNKVRAERNNYRDAVDHLNMKVGGILEERNNFRDQLNRALGWIDHARGFGPGDAEEQGADFAEVPDFNRARRADKGGRLG